MPSIIIVGAQWGDEGKGKITDYLAEQADMVVRYQGGSNAGHTVVVGNNEYKLHLVPSGIFYPDKLSVIGNGVVLDLGLLDRELDYLKDQGVTRPNLRISDRAHLLLPYHHRLDAADEERRGKNKIGTTKRGIGPAYADKAARIGLRVCDLAKPDDFRRRLQVVLDEKNRLLERVHDQPGFTVDEVAGEVLRVYERIRPFVTDTSLIINEALDAGRRVLFEGAQGTLLDIDLGTYPYVTSSHPIAGGACIGAGVGPTRINRVVGVMKAYTTRVGDGPFPTELVDERGEWIRCRGSEYGTTTGRPRRCGWLDLVIVRYAVRVSGLDRLAITRLDTLGGAERVKVCTAYRRKGQIVKEFPASLDDLAECQPVYEELDGWPADIGRPTSAAELPRAAAEYISFVEEQTKCRVGLVSIGRERTQTLTMADIF
ncbi:MAG TPA: adenylosuccinate synthase [Bacillota bacterium]|jgi:adenylosuccinate synthase